MFGQEFARPTRHKDKQASQFGPSLVLPKPWKPLDRTYVRTGRRQRQRTPPGLSPSQKQRHHSPTRCWTRQSSSWDPADAGQMQLLAGGQHEIHSTCFLLPVVYFNRSLDSPTERKRVGGREVTFRGYKYCTKPVGHVGIIIRVWAYTENKPKNGGSQHLLCTAVDKFWTCPSNRNTVWAL